MKMPKMLRDPAPIVLRMAMSRFFSMTNRMSEAMMFSAATITIKPIAIEIAIFSIHSAEKSAWFCWDQSCVRYPGPSISVTDFATSGAAYMSSTRSPIKSTGSRCSNRRATSSETNPYDVSNSNNPSLKMPTTRRRICRGMMPIGDNVPWGVTSVTWSPTNLPRLEARSSPRTTPPNDAPSSPTSASRLP